MVLNTQAKRNVMDVQGGENENAGDVGLPYAEGSTQFGSGHETQAQLEGSRPPSSVTVAIGQYA